MSVRDRMNGIAERVRGIPASATWGERPTSVTIRTRTWRSGRVGREGGYDDASVTLTPTPKVRQLKQQEIAASGGRYVAGDLRVGPITPAHTGGGYSEAQLAPIVTVDGVQVTYVLSGFVNGEYERLNLDNAKSHSWFLVLRKMTRGRQ